MTPWLSNARWLMSAPFADEREHLGTLVFVAGLCDRWMDRERVKGSPVIAESLAWFRGFADFTQAVPAGGGVGQIQRVVRRLEGMQ